MAWYNRKTDIWQIYLFFKSTILKIYLNKFSEKLFITEIKQNSTEHARTCIHRSREIITTRFDVGKMKMFRKNEIKKYVKMKLKNTENVNGLIILKH